MNTFSKMQSLKWDPPLDFEPSDFHSTECDVLDDDFITYYHAVANDGRSLDIRCTMSPAIRPDRFQMRLNMCAEVTSKTGETLGEYECYTDDLL